MGSPPAASGTDQHDNHYKLITEARSRLASLIEDLATSPAKASPGKTLLDETLVVMHGRVRPHSRAAEFHKGRDHHKHCFPAMFAGAGVKGGTVMGPAIPKAGTASIPDGSARSSRESKTWSRRSTRHWGSTGRKRFATLLPAEPMCMSDPLGANGHIPTNELSAIYG